MPNTTNESNFLIINMSSKKLKCVVVGDGSVGKTCLLWVYANEEFPTEYVPTVFTNTVVSNIVVDGVTINLGLWDTAGQEDYDRLRPLSYPGTNVFLLCFSVVSVSSFDNISEKWLPEIKHHTQNVALVLVGTKSDLRDNSEYLESLKKQGESVVDKVKGDELMKKIKAYSYRECSAKKDQGVKEVFMDAVNAGNTTATKEKKGGCLII